jgi:hypothetical protein
MSQAMVDSCDIGSISDFATDTDEIQWAFSLTPHAKIGQETKRSGNLSR